MSHEHIDDGDIIAVLKEYGPSRTMFIADVLGGRQYRQIVSRKLGTMIKYRMVDKMTLDFTNYYMIPGDRRPPSSPPQGNKRGQIRKAIEDAPVGAEFRTRDFRHIGDNDTIVKALKASGLKVTVEKAQGKVRYVYTKEASL